jgi:hypothetical protein
MNAKSSLSLNHSLSHLEKGWIGKWTRSKQKTAPGFGESRRKAEGIRRGEGADPPHLISSDTSSQSVFPFFFFLFFSFLFWQDKIDAMERELMKLKKKEQVKVCSCCPFGHNHHLMMSPPSQDIEKEISRLVIRTRPLGADRER